MILEKGRHASKLEDNRGRYTVESFWISSRTGIDDQGST
jgi:hypothetical protein